MRQMPHRCCDATCATAGRADAAQIAKVSLVTCLNVVVCMHTFDIASSTNLKVRSNASFWLEERPLSTAMLSTKPASGMETTCSSLDPGRLAASVRSYGTLHIDGFVLECTEGLHEHSATAVR